MEIAERGEDDENIEKQSEIGDHAREKIVRRHERHDERKTPQHRADSLLHRIFSEARADGPLFFYDERRRQRTRAQHDGKVLGLVDVETPRYLGLSRRDLFIDHRCRLHLAVQHDREPAADASARDL